MPDSTKRGEKGRVRRVVAEAAEGESGGPDEMTYEMWQEALEVRKLSSGGETAAGGVDRSVYEAFSEEGRIGRRTRGSQTSLPDEHSC